MSRAAERRQAILTLGILGKTYNRLQQPQRAAAEFAQLVDMGDRSPKLLLEYAVALYLSGSQNAAQIQLEELLKQWPTSKGWLPP